MMYSAVSIGSSVPRDHFDATVQSVFDSSVNLRLADQDRLVTVLVSEHYDLPQGIRLDAENLPFQSLTVDLHAACRAGVLRFHSLPLTIDLRGARNWDGRLSRIAVDMQKPLTERAWSIVWQTLNRGQRLRQTDLIADDLFQTDAGSLLTRRLSQPVQQLIAATKHLDSQSAASAAGKMIGLGPGVTPSGDDLLIGYLAGLWSTAAHDEKRLGFLSGFGRALPDLTKQTNEISRTYLYYAILGEFSSSILALVDAISEGEDQQLRSVANDVMRVGHSSGMDSVTGLLIGMAAWAADSSIRKVDTDVSTLDKDGLFRSI